MTTPLAFLTTPATSKKPPGPQARPDVLRLPLAEAQTEHGYDALLIAETLGLSVKELADYLDRDPAGLRRNPDSVKLQPQLGQLAVLAELVILSESRGYLRVWLRTPNPAMGYRSPFQRLMDDPHTAAASMTEQIVSVLSGQGQ